MSSDDRCPAVHPTLGIRCKRKVWDCWGIDHLGIWESGYGEFWPNPHGTTPVSRFFEEWVNALQKVTEELEKGNMKSTNGGGGAQAPQPTSKPPCPICS